MLIEAKGDRMRCTLNTITVLEGSTDDTYVNLSKCGTESSSILFLVFVFIISSISIAAGGHFGSNCC